MTVKIWGHTDKEFNEDMGGGGLGWLCVIDGATTLNGSVNGNWTTSEFVKCFMNEISRTGLSPKWLRSDIACALVRTQKIVTRSRTTATISAVAWDDETVATAVLGDSVVLVGESQHTLIVRDPSFLGREHAFLQPVEQALSAGISPQLAYSAAMQVLSEERNKRNTSEGVWVISDSDSAHEISSHLDVRNFSRRSVNRVAAVSDGLWRAVGLYKLLSATELLNEAQGDNVMGVIHALRRMERDDMECSVYPRFSSMDDATMVFKVLH